MTYLAVACPRCNLGRLQKITRAAIERAAWNITVYG
jgi:hypothetical protein